MLQKRTLSLNTGEFFLLMLEVVFNHSFVSHDQRHRLLFSSELLQLHLQKLLFGMVRSQLELSLGKFSAQL